jgi:DNA-binding MarR family transcriptional regulator
MTRHLNADEQAAWEGLQRMHAQLSPRLRQDLSARGAISPEDYQVLAVLNSSPGGQTRAHTLSRELGWEKSRLSHHITRMVSRRLVTRREDPTDRRGRYVAITSRGRRAVEMSAPEYADAVHRSLLDLLTPAQLALLADITRTVVHALGGEQRATLSASRRRRPAAGSRIRAQAVGRQDPATVT